MAAKFGSFQTTSCGVLFTILRKSRSNISHISIKRIPSFSLSARNFSFLNSPLKTTCSLDERCKRGHCVTWAMSFTLARCTASMTGSRSSQINKEEEEEESIKTSSDKLKKLTLDDIISLWPDGKPAWIGYRRNHKGQIPPKTTRLRCTTVSKKLLTQNPCPVCRVRVEKNYELDSKDVVFLSQFVNPQTGEVLDTRQTGVCRQQQKKLINMLERSKDQGYMPFTIPGPRDPPRKFKPVGIPAPNIRNKTG